MLKIYLNFSKQCQWDYQISKEKRDLEHYLKEIKIIFDRKTLQVEINKLNRLLDKKDEMPECILFLKKLSKKSIEL